MLNGDVVDAELRDPEVSRRIANVADLRSVRELVNDVQRRAAHGRDLILDGRDCGTVVFPDAEIKVYLTADALSRARRRHEQMLLNKRPQAMQPLAEVVSDLEARDARDRARPFGALRQAPDAVVVDTSGLTYEEGWQLLLRAVEEHPAFRARLASTHAKLRSEG
jgi:cytidylate kinase